MTTEQVSLQGFAFGEHLEGVHKRSLGFRLLAPAEPEPWGAEVESLARRLQAAPYPDHWPPVELFCSLLLSDGRRLIAVARYGLADHTPSQRRGGLELVGVVAPGNLGVPTALAIYHWLRRRRAETVDLHTLGDRYPLVQVLAAVPPVVPAAETVPVLPIRLWQEGALLFAATAPSDPDHHLGLLEQGTASAWQWLPLVGTDFPLQTHAQRGPVVAWTPHLSGVAVKLDRKPAEGPLPWPGRGRVLTLALLSVLLLLLVANLWATVALPGRLRTPQPVAPTATNDAKAEPAAAAKGEGSAGRFAKALQRLLHGQGGAPEWSPAQLSEQYERLAAADKDLGLANPEGREVVVAVGVLSKRSGGRIEAAVRKALKGYDPRLVNLACQQVQEQLTTDAETP
jgi:hypothetical protein